MKKCMVCRRVLKRRIGELPNQFAKRVTCGASCYLRRTTSCPKSCPICGSEFSRRSDESATNFSHRKACSEACKRALIAKTRLEIFADNATRKCNGCDKPLVRRPDEKRWHERMTCGHRECQRLARARSGPKPILYMWYGMKVTVYEVAAVLGIKPVSAYARIQRGTIPGIAKP